jgi:hypothetical protein
VDLVLELIVSVIVQFVVEVLGELLVDTALRGVASAMQSRLGRYVVAALLGELFGVWWGHHLSGHGTLPKLLWVSLVFAVAAFVLSLRARGSESPLRGAGWSRLLLPPWRWSRDRLIGLGILNLVLAQGIVIGFLGGHG